MKNTKMIFDPLVLLILIFLLLFTKDLKAFPDFGMGVNDPYAENGVYPPFDNSLPSDYILPSPMGWDDGDETPLPGDGGDERDDDWVDAAIAEISVLFCILFILACIIEKRYSMKKEQYKRKK